MIDRSPPPTTTQATLSWAREALVLVLAFTAGAGAYFAAVQTPTLRLQDIAGALAAGATATFVVTNTSVAIGDVVVLSVRSGPTAATSVFSVSAVAAGSFSVKAWNLSAATADTGAPILNFAVIKAVGA